MAGFCPKCGTPLASNSGFCTSCGAPVAAGVAPAQPVPPSPQQAAGYPPAPQATSSGGTLKIVLIVVAVVFGLGILGAGALGFMAWRVSKSITVDSKGNGATMSLPGVGSVSTGDTAASASELGVPPYPGAVREKGSMNMNTATASMVMAHFSTNDSQSQVVDFYKGKMGDGAVAVATGNGTVINSGGQDTDRIMVTVGPGNGDDAGKTTIVVVHTKKK
jgi:hypothetical protein